MATVVDTHTSALTLDDVATLAERRPDQRLELDEGRLQVMPPPDLEHGVLTTRLTLWLASVYPPELVLAAAGLRVAEASGRNPDLLLLRHPVPGSTVWVDPADVVLAVEIVSPGSQHLDRVVKPDEYARAGVGKYWRIERNPATVHRYRLADDAVYEDVGAVPLGQLLTWSPKLLRPTG